jgi:hypothetical protein
MKPKIQKVTDGKNGDCFGACVASILELDDWPNFNRKEKGPWIDQWNDYLAPRNLEIVYVPGGHPPPNGYCLMVINSVNFAGATHSVVWKGDGKGSGEVVHDPSPLKHPKDYEPVGWYCFAVLDPLKLFNV